MKKTVFQSFGLFLILLLPLGCEEGGDENTGPNDFSDEIMEMVPQEVMDHLLDLGMTIYKGNQPPRLNNIYLVTPNYLLESSNPDDQAYFEWNERLFPDITVRFFNQVSNDNSISIQTSQLEEGASLNGFVSGSGSSFTVFSRHESTSGVEVILVYSGKLTANGISEWKHAVYMVYNNWEPGTIDNYTARVFIDYDTVAGIY